MFENAFKYVDDILRKDSGCSTALDYVEQSSWVKILEQVGYSKILIIEIPTSGELSNSKYTLAHSKLNEAKQAMLRGEWKQAVSLCRDCLETLPTFTEANGHFTVPKISSEKIQIQHQGYQTFSISPEALNVPDCPKFQLQPILQNLDEVITHRYSTTGISKKNDGTIVIKPKKFGLLPGLIEPDVLQTMQQIPGIISIDETISNINVRGGTHDQNLFLWNGIRMFQTGHFFGLISAFNPSLAQNITISKNGSSAFFGESVSSLIDISSQNSNTENTNASLSSNMISAEFYTKVKISDNSNFTFSARRSLTDIFQSPTYRSYSNRIFQNTVITDLTTNAIVGYKSNVVFYFYDITAQFEQKIGATTNGITVVVSSWGY